MRPPSPFAARGLYLITPDEPDTARLLRMLDEALQPPVCILQYRSKSVPSSVRLQQATEIKKLCVERHVALIINDDIELALQINADGVHLGKDDDDIREARLLLGKQKIIGASCYNDIERAQTAVETGADYVAFGAVYASQTKPYAPRASLELIREAAQLGKPIVAIGGISADNADEVLQAGAHQLAVIQSVFGADSVRAAVQQFQSIFQRYEN
jgi:thiamine-phosphate pyrophosphorylase